MSSNRPESRSFAKRNFQSATRVSNSPPVTPWMSFVDNSLVVEVKATDPPNPIHQAQLVTYLRLGGYQIGLLLNFNRPTLKDGITRLRL